MKPNSKITHLFHQEDTNSFWKWRENNGNPKRKKQEKEFPLAKFLSHNLKKGEEAALGPGGGIGIGCGVGLGFGVTGGVGYGGGSWNHLKMVFGVGLGCGVGVGFGYGQGIGFGFSLESLESHFSNQSSHHNKRGYNSDMTLW